MIEVIVWSLWMPVLTFLVKKLIKEMFHIAYEYIYNNAAGSILQMSWRINAKGILQKQKMEVFHKNWIFETTYIMEL